MNNDEKIEKKNNALEKAENMTDVDGAKITQEKPSNETKKKNVRKTRTASKSASVKKAKTKAKKDAKKKAAQARKAKAEAKKQERENLKALKIAKKEERLARKQELASESKEEREKRIAREKQAKLKIKAEKANKKAELKKARAERKAEMKAQRQNHRREKTAQRAQMKERARKDRQSRGIGGWLAAVISLGSSVLVLASVLAVSLFTNLLDFGQNRVDAQNSERAFYDLVGYADNLETNMSKLFVASDAESRQRILGDITVQSSLADVALSSLPLTDESKYYAHKYVNQVGDYAKYLNNRLIDGQTFDNADYDRLVELYNITLDFKTSLDELNANVSDGYDFKRLRDNNRNDVMISGFNDFEEGARNYPEMIYDGAFSDGLTSKNPRGLGGEEKNEEQIKQIFYETFENYGVGEAKVVGTTENGAIDCFNVEAKTNDGEIFAQLSKIGGRLVTFNAYREPCEEKIDEKECVEAAKQFLERVGFDNMKCVWSYSSGGQQRLNFAATQDGVILYPDLVKVNVCKETGKVLAIDADNYFTNHVERTFGKAKFSLDEAYEKIDVKLDVEDENVAVIPLGNGKEKLAYEFIGQYNDSTYYVYIDASTLKELDIYKVVETEEGRLLL